MCEDALGGADEVGAPGVVRRAFCGPRAREGWWRLAGPAVVWRRGGSGDNRPVCWGAAAGYVSGGSAGHDAMRAGSATPAAPA